MGFNLQFKTVSALNLFNGIGESIPVIDGCKEESTISKALDFGNKKIERATPGTVLVNGTESSKIKLKIFWTNVMKNLKDQIKLKLLDPVINR